MSRSQRFFWAVGCLLGCSAQVTLSSSLLSELVAGSRSGVFSLLSSAAVLTTCVNPSPKREL